MKLLTRWGIEQELRDMSIYMPGFRLSRFETGEPFGTHVWEDEFLAESGGEIRTVNYSAFRKLLKDTAVNYGVDVRTKCRVTAVESKQYTQPTVTLQSGETIRADVVLGADGMESLVRTTVVGPEKTPEWQGINAYNIFIPGDRIVGDPGLEELLNDRLLCGTFGNNRGYYSYAVPAAPSSEHKFDYVMNLWIREEVPQERWKAVDTKTVLEKMGEVEPRARKLVGLATVISSAPAVERESLEDWVHKEGRVLILGDAAHIFFPCSLQNLGVAVCDAATLGHLFQHLHHHRQIDQFLNAFEEIRPARIQYMKELEFSNLEFMTLENGPVQEQRDQALRERYKKGLNALDSDEQDALVGANVATRFEAMMQVFCYDAEEEADKWWVDWGSLQERASFSNINADFSVQVQQLATVETVNRESP
ncbi:hypothetical protein EUX98_g2408 [Antrodiella citrinella]|uniref:FAD-binding domain-containing protein n=1 Tax=Antrodiella citrinella TaxID=2447956 RepID=A0A4V3XJ63_9APHY|nr:hypothetical protein EUX98_g2408 [Antrodiella citrinella]